MHIFYRLRVFNGLKENAFLYVIICMSTKSTSDKSTVQEVLPPTPNPPALSQSSGRILVVGRFLTMCLFIPSSHPVWGVTVISQTLGSKIHPNFACVCVWANRDYDVTVSESYNPWFRHSWSYWKLSPHCCLFLEAAGRKLERQRCSENTKRKRRETERTNRKCSGGRAGQSVKDRH